ncbi:hypothetical protein Smp_143550 [Schistosoma mansoni]|uniref:hypothetical protein n=1 Tax=Schistosoma mansoni TaxID=6183 RepID=UPI0001A6435D|nr:hypothetical protein Smp_143550 [Schistosoma mansoni]|eukprot:XP_018650530.1 hypothetical protein Smp_143550 [Schistosoma mansoni]
MELMKEYALIQQTDSSGKNSLSTQLIQYNINLKRLDENVRKVERKHEILKCQFEKIKQNTREESILDMNKTLNNSFNNQELQQVIKRTKQILDAQEITLKSISFNNNDDDEYDSVDNNMKHEELYKLSFINKTRIETPQKDGDNNEMKNKEENDKELRKDEDEELGQRRQINEITDDDESSSHVVHKIRSPIFSEDLNYSSDDFYKQSRLFHSNILSNNNSNGVKSNKNNDSQQMVIEEDEETEDDNDTQETEDENKVELKWENVYPTVPNKNEIIQKDSTNANLLSSWTTYKTDDLEDDSFYD